jgi:heterodisulfide reductase subunit A-like polyferredoxin
MPVKVNPNTLVVGGGIAGLQATLELADPATTCISSNAIPPSAATWLSSTRPSPRRLLGLYPHAQDVRGRPARETSPLLSYSELERSPARSAAST